MIDDLPQPGSRDTSLAMSPREAFARPLREARSNKHLTLDQVAAATKIPKSSLAHLEAGRFEALPAPVFVRGFIRAYARVVGLDPNQLVRLFEACTADDDPRARVPEPSPHLPRAPQGPTSPTNIERRLDTNRKLVPLQPVSERREAGFRGGYTLLAVVAVGLLVAAWFLVGGKTPGETAAAQRGPTTPALHERIDGLPSLDGGSTTTDAGRPANAGTPR